MQVQRLVKVKPDLATTTRMNEMPNLVEDLHGTIANIKTNNASIAFHPMSESIGNLWTVRGSKKNHVVILLYRIKSEPVAESDKIDRAVNVKHEGIENFLTPLHLEAIDTEIIKLLQDEITSGEMSKTRDDSDSGNPKISVKQEPDDDFVIDYETKNLRSLSNYEHITMDKHHVMVTSLVEDLRGIVDYVNMGAVIITVNSLCNGNIWTIPGPKKNLVILLYYGNEFELVAEEDGIDREVSITRLNENSLMDLCSETAVQDINIPKLHGSTSRTDDTMDRVIVIKQEPIENLAIDSEHVATSTFYSADASLSQSMTCDQISSEDIGGAHTYSCNVENNKFMNYQNCKIESQCNDIAESRFHYDPQHHSIPEVALGDNTNIHMIDCKIKTEDIHDSLVLEDSKTYIRLNYVIPFIEEDSSEFQTLQRLYKLNSNEASGSHRLEHEQTMGLKSSSEQLNISRLKNIQRAKEEQTTYSCDENGKISHQCQDCGLMDNLNSNKIHATGDKKFSCCKCENSYSKLSSLKQHIRKKHSQNLKLKKKLKHKQVQNGKKKFRCLECDKQLCHQQSLSQHKIVHTGAKPHECLECGKKFTQRGSLNQHMLLHTGEKPHECLHCGKKFTKKNTLNRHLVVHTGLKAYECQECKKKFGTKGDLEMHKRIHSGKKPFHCSLCVKKFDRKSSLNLHQMVHTGEKPHKCSMCDQKFIRPGLLKEHMLIHSGERPYTCSVCNHTFTRTSSLKEHMLIHSAERPYKCSECDRTFNARSGLRQHVKRYHKVHMSTKSVDKRSKTRTVKRA